MGTSASTPEGDEAELLPAGEAVLAALPAMAPLDPGLLPAVVPLEPGLLPAVVPSATELPPVGELAAADPAFIHTM